MTSPNNSTVVDQEEDIHLSDEEGGIRIDGIYIPPPPVPYCSVENKGPRLIITKITNNFFKSYGTNRILGPFHKCFNSIVGPNGSGKSNVIDSMLFVFGYRATKIRSKKLSVLLHNSVKYPNITSCTVAVHFAEIIDKEGDEYDVVPNSEFIVARTANKDNSSFYTLNGKKTLFKEIGTLLKKHGIDLDHDRFLILQGEVEQISLMAAKGTDSEPGMLEYLEDIIGTSRYKVPLAQLINRVESLSEQRVERLNRLKLVETDLKSLEGPKDQAVAYLKLENDIVVKKNLLLQKNVSLFAENIKKSEENKLEIDVVVEEITEKLNNIASEIKSVTNSLDKVATDYEKLKNNKEKLKEAFAMANNEDLKLQENMRLANNKRKKLKQNLIAEESRFESYQKNPEDVEKEVKVCEEMAEKMSQKKEKLQADRVEMLKSLVDATKELQEKKKDMENDLAELKKSLNALNTTYTVSASELNLYVRDQESESKKLQNIKQSYESVESKIQQYSAEIEKLKKMLPENEANLSKANKELQAIKVDEGNVIRDVNKKRSMLEEKKSAMQATRSRGRVLDALMRQKIEGNCPGLFGRLGDLGAIDGKYDVAVSTACGPLDSIVVDTVETGQWCIEFLKKHDIGRVTIIVLEKQEHLRRHYQTPLQTPENVPRLFDLIRVEDERIKPAFYYAVRNTLVAKDLDQGSRIAYGAQRFRVVTLGGDLIELTGTMSGGGRQVSRGRMGQSVAVSNIDPKELESIEDEVNELQHKLRQIQQKQPILENTVSDLSSQINQMNISYQKFNMQLTSLKREKHLLTDQLQNQEKTAAKTKADPLKVKEMTSLVEEKKAAYEESLDAVNSLQTEVTEINDEINRRTQGKVEVIDKNIKETTKSIEKFKTEITKLRVGLTTAERNSQKSAKLIETMKQDITNEENSMKSMKVKREEIEEDAKKLLKCLEEVNVDLSSGEEDFSEYKAKISELTKTENKIKGEKIEIDQKLKDVTEKLEDSRGKVNVLKSKIKQLRLQSIPDETIGELKTYSEEELEEIELNTIQRQLNVYEDEYKKANPNLEAIVEYKNKQTVFIKRTEALLEITEQRNKVRGYHNDLHARRKQEFVTGYNIIKMKVKEMYQMITMGGDADFEMLDTYDPFNEGIQFRVRPPKKTWKLITNLSGGEKTLSSLALVFALHYYKPSPLYVMDEIDAALDFKNVSIVANYIKERTKNAQFIIISLRANMFELSDRMIGIYKIFNITNSVALNPKSFDQNRTAHSEETNDQNDVVLQNEVVQNGSLLNTSVTATAANS
ncbi:PREDICTED: structural maintenance of chromosomes protein 4 [Nicrophorus vespilloides]|uniref:Structural maintenance of chromosomes protein n=1 Tax=Nicrophorus vespilloides TaxID=110193 RepID=A0ABM1N4V9_NICVS|nr:PREDICTED: structural maintenance of chromosomes protein 4 [Nicrophorus vespilloides]